MKDILGHFSLQALPFTRELAVSQHFSLPQFDAAADGLFEAVDNRMSAALIAPAGTGKTSVLRRLQSRLPDARYRVSYLKVTNLSRREMAREIATALGLPPAGSYPMLVRRLQEGCISSLDTESRRPVLLIDEAHEMRPDVLSMLRVLTNFDMDSRLVVSLVLTGQSKLDRKSTRLNSSHIQKSRMPSSA